jgi:tRNA A37 methylthiotransferase MiaB
MNRPARISFVSLSCPKALVDSERIITRLRAERADAYDLHGTVVGY